jgi:hypothetical protein
MNNQPSVQEAQRDMKKNAKLYDEIASKGKHSKFKSI